MAKRISSLFSSKDHDLSQSHASSHLNTFDDPPASSRGKLTKPMAKSSSDVNLHRMGGALEPPPTFTDSGMHTRPMSREGRNPLPREPASSRHSSASRPQTPTMLEVPGTASPTPSRSPSPGRAIKRKSWIPGKQEKNVGGAEPEQPSCQAWIAGLKEMVPYELDNLLHGQPVDDLWDDTGDVIVYLYPQTSRKGPSFRVNSQLFADSRTLSYLIQPTYSNENDQPPYLDFDPASYMGSLSLHDGYGRPQHQPQDNHPNFSRPTHHAPEQQPKALHLPLGLEGDFSRPGTTARGDDLELIVLYRNFFAFLCGGALVATPRQNSLYSIFMSISSILRRLQYGNEKESSWGTVPWASFSRYTDELHLGDVRASREKNIEAILLGIAMKSWPLYAEGYSHAVGRLGDIKSINSPKFSKIPPALVDKLERAHHNLFNNRLQPLQLKLDNFYFPSMFAGVANSQTSIESKVVNFKAWKAHFMDFRQHTMTQYKKKYGNWPPKASSKKNNFEESGLNRLLIREVYQEFTDLYEMLVDRTSLTPRPADLPPISNVGDNISNESIQHVLRQVENEYDRSVPPVAPPIPFDVPIIPAFGRIMLARDTQNNKKLKDSELQEVLLGSYNRESMKPTQWISDFLEYEHKLCHGKTIHELADVRCGVWLFMYAVLQALPMTVVDARDLQYTEGVEYFLCEAPRGGRPWMQYDDSTSRAWFNVTSGGGLVSMPADTIDHSVEGIYRRSHCWQIANGWAEALGPLSPVRTMGDMHQFASPNGNSPYLMPKPASAAPSPYNSPLLRPVLPAMGDENTLNLPRVSSRQSMNLGLEAVAPPEQARRPSSTYNPSVTFDNILASQNIQQKAGKKGKK